MITYIGTDGRYHDGNGIDYGYPLPAGFPAREKLAQSGFAYTEQVKRATDEQLLRAGIAQSTLTKVRGAVNGI